MTRRHTRLKMRLHWAAVVLTAAQFLVHAPMETAFEALHRGFALPSAARLGAWVHIAVGAAVFLLATACLSVRLRHGATDASQSGPLVLRRLSGLVRFGLYVCMLALPLSGGLAWFAGSQTAALIHGWISGITLGLLALHISGTVLHHVWFKTDLRRDPIRSRDDG